MSLVYFYVLKLKIKWINLPSYTLNKLKTKLNNTFI